MTEKVFENSEKEMPRAKSVPETSPYVSAKPFDGGGSGLSVERVLGSIEPSVQRQANQTGMPDQLKNGIEKLSGMDMSGVRVHRNSSEPAKVGAHAYTQGSTIHLGPGQERHLPHEAWHVVQQAQGRVKPTGTVAGMPLNDDKSLESEADTMGASAMRMGI